MELSNFFGKGRRLLISQSEYDIKRDEVAQELGWDVAKVERGIEQLIGESTLLKTPAPEVDVSKQNDSETKKPKAKARVSKKAAA